MKKICKLLFSATLCLSAVRIYPKEEQPIKINMTAIDAIDNATLDISSLVYLLKQINNMLELNYSTKEDCIITIKDLAEKERSLNSSQTTQFLKKQFEQFSKVMYQSGYADLVDMHRDLFKRLMQAWASQRKKLNSALYNFSMEWTRGLEISQLSNRIKSISEYHTYLSDCVMLLQDLIHSMPNSYQLYLASEKLLEQSSK